MSGGGGGPPRRPSPTRLELHRELGLQVIGHLHGCDRPLPTDTVRRPILGPAESIAEVLHERVVDEVVICLPVEDIRLVEPIARLCQEEGRIVRIPLIDMALSLPGGRVEDFDGDRGAVPGPRPGPDARVERQAGDRHRGSRCWPWPSSVRCSSPSQAGSGSSTAGPVLLPPEPGGPPRPAVPGHQVPDDGARRRGVARRSSTRSDDVHGPAFKLDGRSPPEPDRGDPAPNEPRRAAPAPGTSCAAR